MSSVLSSFAQLPKRGNFFTAVSSSGRLFAVVNDTVDTGNYSTASTDYVYQDMGVTRIVNGRTYRLVHDLNNVGTYYYIRTGFMGSGFARSG